MDLIYSSCIDLGICNKGGDKSVSDLFGILIRWIIRKATPLPGNLPITKAIIVDGFSSD